MSRPGQPLPDDPSESVHDAGEPGGTSSTPPLNQTGSGRAQETRQPWHVQQLNQIRYLAATLIWSGLIVALIAAFAPTYPPDPGVFYAKVFGGTILGAALLWLIARKRRWSFLLLVFVALPCFIVGFGVAGVGVPQG